MVLVLVIVFVIIYVSMNGNTKVPKPFKSLFSPDLPPATADTLPTATLEAKARETQWNRDTTIAIAVIGSLVGFVILCTIVVCCVRACIRKDPTRVYRDLAEAGHQKSKHVNAVREVVVVADLDVERQETGVAQGHGDMTERGREDVITVPAETKEKWLNRHTEPEKEVEMSGSVHKANPTVVAIEA